MTLPRWLALFTLLLIVPLTQAQAPDAAEKQLRRQLSGMAKAHPAPFVGPKPLAGELGLLSDDGECVRLTRRGKSVADAIETALL